MKYLIWLIVPFVFFAFACDNSRGFLQTRSPAVLYKLVPACGTTEATALVKSLTSHLSKEYRVTWIEAYYDIGVVPSMLFFTLAQMGWSVAKSSDSITLLINNTGQVLALVVVPSTFYTNSLLIVFLHIDLLPLS